MISQKNFTRFLNIFKASLFALIFVVSFSACAQKATHATITYNSSRVIDTKGMENDILNYINQYRASINLPALQIINAATEQATQHSIDMSKRTTSFGHEGYNDRMENIQKKIGFVHASAENVAYGKLTAREVVDLWLNSPGHKKNIEGSYTLTGIGVAKDANGVVFYTQIFLKK